MTKVLLVEDDPTTVESIKLCLEISDPDLSVVATSKGLEALAMLKEGGYDILVIDLGLPDIDGVQVLEKLRAFSHIPAVVISARQSPESVSKAMASGADVYVTKPFYHQNLVKRIKSLVNKPG